MVECVIYRCRLKLEPRDGPSVALAWPTPIAKTSVHLVRLCVLLVSNHVCRYRCLYPVQLEYSALSYDIIVLVMGSVGVHTRCIDSDHAKYAQVPGSLCRARVVSSPLRPSQDNISDISCQRYRTPRLGNL
ncbi:hypothetical protein GQ600_11514 [Phytophthora cactorum]|nr:hypothetical protein GQ600_11514 [Phytophthora cactorum]